MGVIVHQISLINANRTECLTCQTCENFPIQTLFMIFCKIFFPSQTQPGKSTGHKICLRRFALSLSCQNTQKLRETALWILTGLTIRNRFGRLFPISRAFCVTDLSLSPPPRHRLTSDEMCKCVNGPTVAIHIPIARRFYSDSLQMSNINDDDDENERPSYRFWGKIFAYLLLLHARSLSLLV